MNNITIGAYYYPYYYENNIPWKEKQPENEMELLRSANPLFKTHLIRRPVNTHFYPAYPDQDNPGIVESQVRLAKDSGIDVFIFNWYRSNNGTLYLNKPLDRFVQLNPETEFKCAINWCFSLPKRNLPHLPGEDKNDHWRDIAIETRYFEETITYCCENYFSHPGYLKVNNRPALYLFNLKTIFERDMMTCARFNQLLEKGNKIALNYNFPGIYYIGIIPRWDEKLLKTTSDCSLDAATGYAFLPDFGSDVVIQNYGQLIRKRTLNWVMFRKAFSFPWLPTVVSGWDASSRGRGVTTISKSEKNLKYPWSPIVTGVSPEKFGKWLQFAADFINRYNVSPAVIHIASWNEWTEGNAIEPSDQFGFGFLEQILKFKKSTRS